MKTIKNIIDQFTNPEIIYNNILETLRETDPSFAVEEAHFITAISCLKEGLNEVESNNLDTYLSAAREEISSVMVYTGWLGFQLNLDCWKNPISRLMLNQNYEEITQERTFDSLPAIKRARKIKETIFQAMSESQKIFLLDVISFFSYLHTVAPKLSHLAGFQLADQFLYHVIPGYCHDSVITLQYMRELEEYLELNRIPIRG